LVRQEGVAVVWATHLVDEVADDDDLIVLHRGRILAQGRVSDIAAGADIGAAFLRLTQQADLANEAA